MDITTYIAAAFTDQKFAGSPTGVVLGADGLSDAQMQQIANQTNCSHTAFVTEIGQDDCDVDIRFFTPAGEIKNCGHGTIAAHVVRALHTPAQAAGVVRQKAASGVQDVEVRHQNDGVMVYLKQDAIRFSEVEEKTLNDLLAVLHLPASALDTRYPVIVASPGANRFLVAVNSTEMLRGLKPDSAALKQLCQRFNGIGCFVYALTSPLEATARMFAPGIGIDEDNVNGNSSGCLGAYLLHLDNTRSEIELRVHQGHAFNRPGTVLVNAKRVREKIETVIGGTAVIETRTAIPLD